MVAGFGAPYSYTVVAGLWTTVLAKAAGAAAIPLTAVAKTTAELANAFVPILLTSFMMDPIPEEK